MIWVRAELLIAVRISRVAERYLPAELLVLWSDQRRDVNSPVAVAHPISQEAGNAPAGRTVMLWTVFAILLLLWLLGWGFHVAGSLIHLILVIALVVLLVEVITGRRAAI